MMTDKQQQAAAALFAEEWKGKLGCFSLGFLHNFSLLCSIFFLGCTIFILLRSMNL